MQGDVSQIMEISILTCTIFVVSSLDKTVYSFKINKFLFIKCQNMEIISMNIILRFYNINASCKIVCLNNRLKYTTFLLQTYSLNKWLLLTRTTPPHTQHSLLHTQNKCKQTLFILVSNKTTIYFTVQSNKQYMVIYINFIPSISIYISFCHIKRR